MQPSLFASVQWTVSLLTKYIRDLLDADVTLQDVWVEGEISNLSRPGSGHIYFTLKDAGASLRCVMWKANAARSNLLIREGMSATIHGNIGVYEVGGQYQLYADQVRPVGEGALYQEFLLLKAKLSAEGLFDPGRKRPIPIFPKRIGIVTSASGAALRDMLNVLRRRLPLVEVVLAPAPVQGEDAPPKLIGAIAALNTVLPPPDVILLARGGGSIEDLWAFNDERLVRAIVSSEIPVISGVGHETDFSLSDFAADLRAATPTAAAELATQITVADLGDNLRTLDSQMSAHLLDLFNEHQNALASLREGLRFFSPRRHIQSERQTLDDLTHQLYSGIDHRFSLESNELKSLDKRLMALHPHQILSRGYALVTRLKDGQLIQKTSQARGAIRIRVSDGEFDADVKK
jgi:exodeoxyribonuclease VII large subunit